MTRKMLCFLTLTVLLCALVFQTAAASVAFTTNRQLPDAMAGVYYSARIKADPSAEISFKLEPGDYQEHNFPKGMTLDRTGLLYGTPQKAGTYKFVVKVTLKPPRQTQCPCLRCGSMPLMRAGLKAGEPTPTSSAPATTVWLALPMQSTAVRWPWAAAPPFSPIRRAI